MRIIYVPLEPLRERYTLQLAAEKCGWLEWRWNQCNIPYLRIEGKQLNKEIKVGSVLDATGRGYWACSQIMEILRLLNAGEITSEDVIFFDDFWHPGISALPYCFHLTNVHPKMYAVVYAQSVDPHDFTYPMRNWMRPFEKGIASVLSGIFVASTSLKSLLLAGGVGVQDDIYVTGLIYNSDEVRTHFPAVIPERKRQVVYSSRWDREKRPDIFLDIVNAVVEEDPTIKFVITTSAKELKSNDPYSLALLKDALQERPNLELRENQTKEQYYRTLLESKIQINTADQDFVSFTLLEATTCGCRPLYPRYLSFPEALENNEEFMYEKNDVSAAAQSILRTVDLPTPPVSHIYEKYDATWERMYLTMKGEKFEPLYRD